MLIYDHVDRNILKGKESRRKLLEAATQNSSILGSEQSTHTRETLTGIKITPIDHAPNIPYVRLNLLGAYIIVGIYTRTGFYPVS